MTRLLVLNQYYRPGVEADGRLLAQLCESLAGEYEITVVAGRAPGARRPGREWIDGVRVVRVPSSTLARGSLAPRALNYATYALPALPTGMLGGRPAAVLCFTNPPILPALAHVVARRFSAPLVVVCQDVFPEAALALGQLRPGRAVDALGRATRLGLRRAERVVAIGETMRRRLVEKGVAPERIRVIGNWVDTVAIEPRPQENDWSRAHGLAGRFVVMHSGNVGHAQDLDSLVRAATLLEDLERLDVVIVGSGARHAALVQLARSVGARRVRFLPYQPGSSLSESLSSAAVHVVGLTAGLAGYVVPSRILGVLAAGRPVIAAVEQEGETAALVREAGCGLVVPPGSPGTLARAIRDAYERRPELERMGRRARSYAVERADRGIAVERYRALLREVACS